MAKGNMFLGMSRGSVGDVTFYRGRGQQLARARNRAPKNPRSSAQIIQRMILTSASKAYSRLKGICDHSFQGVSYGGESQSYFLKRAMEDIRNFVAESLAMAPSTITDPLRQIGLAWPNDVHEAGYGLLISQGSIPSIPATFVTSGEDKVFDHFGGTITDGASIGDVLTALNAVPGDQLTVVGIDEDTKVFTASRYVIRADASETQLAEEWDGTWDLAAFDQEKSLVDGRLTISTFQGKIKAKWNVDNVSLLAAAIIVSRKVGTVWERSTQRLIPMNPVDNVPATVAIWELGTTQIGVESPYFLNNADD